MLASDALTNLVKVPVQVKKAKFFTDTEEQAWLENYSSSMQYFALRTEIIGDFSALSYLIFSEDDADLLCRLILQSTQANLGEMKNSLLMEVDNIVSASVIMKLSDTYQLQIHGDVPTLNLLDKNNIKIYLDNDLKNFLHSLTLNTYFEVQGHQLKPQFIWYFDEVFLTLLESIHPNLKLT